MVMGRWGEWKPVLVMLATVVVFAAMNTMVKKALNDGISPLVLITFRQLVATLFMAPIAYFCEKKTRPRMTPEIFIYLFFSALLGASLTQYLFFLGMKYTSATFACAFLNMVPVITFLISMPLGLEILNIKSKAGVAKLVGTAVCVAGAMLMTFYRGTALNSRVSHITTASSDHNHRHFSGDHRPDKWTLGSVELIAGTFFWSSWFLVQARLCKKYPAIYSCTAVVFFLSFLQAASLGMATQRSFSVWALTTKMEISTVVFAGIAGSGLGFLAMSWCVEKRGPVFTTAFCPLIQIIVAGIDFSILHGPLYLGSVLGSVLVIKGLYFLLWGKSRESEAKRAEGVGEGQRQAQIV